MNPGDVLLVMTAQAAADAFSANPKAYGFIVNDPETGARLEQALRDGVPVSPDLHEFYEQLDPGIREVVRFIRSEGYVTTDSGDGKTKPPGPDVLPYPHVACQVPVMPSVITHADHLRRLMQMGEAIGKVPPGWQVQLTYDPATDHTRTIVMLLWPNG